MWIGGVNVSSLGIHTFPLSTGFTYDCNEQDMAKVMEYLFWDEIMKGDCVWGKEGKMIIEHRWRDG